MGYHIATRDDSLEKIAQIMSNRTGCNVTSKDVMREVNTTSTSIYSAIVHDKENDSCSPATLIVCTARKWKREQNEYKVTVERVK